MSATTTPGAGAGGRTDAPPGVPVVSPGWGTWRVVLLAWLAVVVVAVLLTGTRPASLGDLQRGLASGEVTAVTLVGALEPGATGQAQPLIFWHDGLLPRYTTVQHHRGFASERQLSQGGIPVVSADLAGELARWTPNGDLDVVSEPVRSVCGTTIHDWCVPPGTALAAVAWGMVTFVTLVAGPQPRRATRWAWFWLLAGLGPVVLVGYLILGLPRPGEPLQPQGRRLTGGWAFLIGLLLPGPGA